MIARASGRIIGTPGSWGWCAATAIVALFLVVPAASAMSISKPFGTLAWQISNYSAFSECGKVRVNKAALWDTKTGAFRGASNVTSPVCGLAGASSSIAEWEPQLALTDQMHFKSNSKVSVTAFWSLALSAAWNVTPFKGCTLNLSWAYPSCSTIGTVEIGISASIFDSTSGGNYSSSVFSALYFNESYWEMYKSTVTGGAATSQSSSLMGNFSGTVAGNTSIASYRVNSKDTYTCELDLNVEVAAEVYTEHAHATTHGAAWATADLATKGHAATLRSIVVR